MIYIILKLETFPWQLEVVYQFFVGAFDETGTYVDDINTIAKKYVFAYNGFWFDVITSGPWSFLDLYSYQVSAVPKPSIELFWMAMVVAVAVVGEARSTFKFECWLWDIEQLSKSWQNL